MNKEIKNKIRIKNFPLALLAATACLLFITGCATKKKTESASNLPPLVWPTPPVPARIAFVQTISRPADVGIKPSGFRKFSRWLTGSEKGNEPLVKPFGLALDENDNLCLTDMAAKAVCYFDRAKKKWRRWEKLGKLHFDSPVAIAKYKGLFYVADSGLRSILVFDESGVLRFRIAEKLERPSGVVVSGEKLFVADSKRHRIVVFDLNGRFLSEFGKNGTEAGEFNFPTHIAADRDGNLYVTDSMNGRVQAFDADGNFKNEMGGIGNTTGHFSRPKGVSVDTFGHIYVIDALFDNVQIFNQAAAFLLNFGNAGQQRGEFWMPNGISISRANEIFIADAYNRRVQVFKYVGGP